ncbi:MAG: hypothetical protein AUH85_16650 [Chloroflexi bacterium 13_1_40CM_4_68_4]|nr:MAG: hypothetical protein AUH85_16650 [Chloroflexi bacterium 13_1_40CM_4_68_4]
MPDVRPLSAEGAVEVTSLYIDLLGAEVHGDRPHVALNMVMSADGRATLAGTADIGSRTDRALLRHLRSLADAVVIGAGTLRANDFAPRVNSREAMDRRELAARPPQPLGVVVSRLGDVPLDRKFFALPQERIVAVSDRTSESTRERLRKAGATVASFGANEVDLAALLRWLLRERRARVVLCEGGPHLVGQLLRARLIDEVFLTQAWRVTAEPGALSWVESDAALDIRLEPLESYEGDGERYGRFHVTYSR